MIKSNNCVGVKCLKTIRFTLYEERNGQKEIGNTLQEVYTDVSSSVSCYQAVSVVPLLDQAVLVVNSVCYAS